MSFPSSCLEFLLKTWRNLFPLADVLVSISRPFPYHPLPYSSQTLPLKPSHRVIHMLFFWLKSVFNQSSTAPNLIDLTEACFSSPPPLLSIIHLFHRKERRIILIKDKGEIIFLKCERWCMKQGKIWTSAKDNKTTFRYSFEVIWQLFLQLI
jgi:hypothetical protein